MEASNIKSMRDALNEIRSRLSYLYGHIDGTFDPPALKEVYEIAGTALSAPPRNCDVGTTDEQVERFQWFCDTRPCDCCKLKDKVNETLDCAIHWAQMPYEEGENAEVKK